MKKNRRIFLYVILAVILIAALYLANNPITGSAITRTEEIDFSRETYPEYYRLLPLKPSDFSEIRLMYTTGIITDIPERINESYWKQPEWFPLYEETFLPTLKMIVEQHRIAIWSIGIYPEQSYKKINQEWLQNPTIPKGSGHGIVEIKENSIVVKSRFWTRAAPGSVKYYGVKISAVYPEKSSIKGEPKFGLETQTVEQDPSITKQHINAWINEPTEFNFEPYFPLLNPDYTKEIWLNVEIKKDTLKGKYVVIVDIGAPSREYQQEQNLKYGLAYTDPSIGMFAEPPTYKLLIEVV